MAQKVPQKDACHGNHDNGNRHADDNFLSAREHFLLYKEKWRNWNWMIYLWRYM
jgi:hypothetical protein